MDNEWLKEYKLQFSTLEMTSYLAEKVEEGGRPISKRVEAACEEYAVYRKQRLLIVGYIVGELAAVIKRRLVGMLADAYDINMQNTGEDSLLVYITDKQTKQTIRGYDIHLEPYVDILHAGYINLAGSVTSGPIEIRSQMSEMKRKFSKMLDIYIMAQVIVSRVESEDVLQRSDWEEHD